MTPDGQRASSGRVLAVVGAESTGKTSLCSALADRVVQTWGLSCAVVPEELRAWCLTQGRTPLQAEQAAIAEAQASAIREAQSRVAVVIADTTPLMTAVYSQWIFGDDGLVERALAWHQQACCATLLLAPDLPWIADPGLRDGPHAQAPVHALLQGHLTQLAHKGARVFSVAGHGRERIDTAWTALQAWRAAELSGLTAPVLNWGADPSLA